MTQKYTFTYRLFQSSVVLASALETFFSNSSFPIKTYIQNASDIQSSL